MKPEDGLLVGRDFFSGIFVSIGGVTVEPAGFVVLVVEAVVAGAVSDSARNRSSSVLGTITLGWSLRVSCLVANELLPKEVFSKGRDAISLECWNICGG
jgi:hypothetical protein